MIWWYFCSCKLLIFTFPVIRYTLEYKSREIPQKYSYFLNFPGLEVVSFTCNYYKIYEETVILSSTNEHCEFQVLILAVVPIYATGDVFGDLLGQEFHHAAIGTVHPQSIRIYSSFPLPNI